MDGIARSKGTPATSLHSSVITVCAENACSPASAGWRHGTQDSLPQTGRRRRVVVSHSGKQHAYRVAAALQSEGRLSAFLTSGYYKPARYPDRLLTWSDRLDRGFRRRHSPEIDANLVVRNWRFELPELLVRRLRRFGLREEPWVFRRDVAFDRWAARRLARGKMECDLFWGFQGSCRDSLKAARDHGLTAVVELAAPHVTTAMRLLSEEAERHPDWADSVGNYHFPVEYQSRLEQEPHLADFCIVASRFAESSLVEAGVNPSRIRRIALGADLHAFSPVPRSTQGTFRVLFAGKVGQHKGIAYLLEAFRRMRSLSTELVIAGPVVGTGRAFLERRDLYTWLGPLDSAALADEMRKCDVLVVPSVIEGFGLVIAEAMATGMPVIASTHSIGPEIIRDGVSGFLVQPRDVDTLSERLQQLATNRRLAQSMGEAAVIDARSFSWDNHKRRVLRFLTELDERDGAA